MRPMNWNTSIFNSFYNFWAWIFSDINKGIKVEAVIDIRENSDSKIVKAVNDAGTTIHWSHTIVDTKGYKRLNSISAMKLSNDGSSVTGNKTLS